MTVTVDKAAAAGNTTIALPASTPGGTPTVLTDLNNLTKTIVFASAQSAVDVQAYLRAVVFTASPDGTQTVTVTADANTTNGLSSGTTLTAYYDHPDGTTHYYGYVSSSLVTWIDAYNAAKSMKFMGMTGYLPTITSPEENAVLTKISTGGAWSSGTRLLKDGTTDKIADNSSLLSSDYNEHSESSNFYWACGPEAGLEYSNGKKYSGSGFGLVNSAFETTFSSSPWGTNQPDDYGYGQGTTEPCMQVNYLDSGIYKWNDLPVVLSSYPDNLKYYFVEFGGYTGSTGTIKKIADDPGSPNASLTVSKSAEVTASYIITYNLDDGTNPGSAPASYTYGAGATLPTPTRTGFTFGGWYIDSGFSGTAVTSIGATNTGNKMFYAKWTANTYTATINTRVDGTATNMTSVELKSGSTTLTATPSSAGVYIASAAASGTYDVYVNSVDTGTDIAITDAVNSTTVDYFTVTFTTADAGTASGSTVSASAGGTAISSGAIVLAGKPVLLTATGGGADYYSYFWSGSGVNGETSSTITMLSLNKKIDALCTVTGRATPATYAVSLYTNGGSIGSGSVTSYTYGVGVKLPTDVTRTDCTFSGWYENSDFSGSPVTTISASDTGDKAFYARWNYTVSGTIIDHDGENASGATVTIRGNNITPKSTSTNSSGYYSFSDIPAGQYNIVAIYEGVTKTIMITVTDSDISNANIQMPEGAKNSVLEIASDTPDVVVGYLDQQFTNSDETYIGTTGNKVEIKLTVEKQGEEAADGAADIQELAGGHTIGMYLDITLMKTMTGVTNSTNSLTPSETLLKIIIPYDLTGKTNVVVYRYHNGVAEAVSEVEYSSDIPTNECYMVNSSENQVIIWTKSFSTYAISYLSTYTVSYDGNGATSGSVPASSTVADSTVWSSPSNLGSLVKTGYTFKGWALTDSATSAVSTYTITEDTVFYAVWSFNSSSGSSSSGSTTTTYIITATMGDGGSISPSGTVSVTKGGSKTFAISPDTGYVISDVLVDSKSVGTVSSYTFSDVTSAHTISAVFIKASGLPYYHDGNGNKIFIGFASDDSVSMKYIAPYGEKVLFSPNPKDFADISGHWAKSYINFVTEREVFVGTGNNVFSPNTGMTRAMLATVIGRLYERSYGELSTTGVHAFTDCDYSSWYGSYIDWCSENSILQGVGGGMFQPDRQVTRQEMAVMLYRFAEFMKLSTSDSTGATLSYSDVSRIASWAQSAAMYCQETGIITGRNSGSFAPADTATRAEVGAILERFIELVV